MQRLIIVVLALLPILLNAQSFWNIVDDDTYHNKSHITDKEFFQDSIILVSGFVSDASCPGHILSSYSLAGQKQWSIGGYHDLISSDSNFIYTAGYTPIDDVIGFEQIVISKYDRDGNSIFSIGYPETPHDYYFEFEPQSINIANDGTILVSSKKTVVKANINGTYIQEFEIITDSDIININSISPSLYLICTENQIYRSDSSFLLLDSILFSSTINKARITNDTVYALFDFVLIRLDTGLNIIDTLITSSTGFQNFEINNNNLSVQTINTDSIEIIKLQDAEISDTLRFPLLANNVEYIVTENNYVFVGNSFTNQIGIYNCRIDNSAPEDLHLQDIEFVDFNIDSIMIEYVTYLEDSFGTGYRFNTALTVKNNGNDTISTFAIFSDLHGGFNCAQNYFYQKFTGLEILPGQTQTVNLKRAYEEGIGSSKLCFQCLAPNSELELISDNNTLCKTFEITGLDTKKQSRSRIYPNPTTDYLIIENPDLSINSIMLIDITGKVLINRAIMGESIKIEMSNLDSGLYLLRINSERSINTQIIVKK